MPSGVTEEAHRADTVAGEKATAFETNYAYRHMFAWQNQLLMEQLNDCSRLLEIGAGIGNFLVDAVQATDRFSQVHALEVSYRTAKIALDRVPGVTSMSLAPAERLPLQANCIDAIVVRGVLHHLEKPKPGIQEMYRVLKPGGHLVIFEGNPASKYRQLVLGLADKLGVEHEVSQYRHLWPEEIAKLLSIFSRTQVRPISGLLAPVAYTGLGGRLVWDGLSHAREMMTRFLPHSFAWWLLWVAQK